MTNMAISTYQLNWASPITEANANQPITETLKLTEGSTLISKKCITFELTGDNAVFEPSDVLDSNAHCDNSENSKRWSHRTDTLGRAYPVIKPLKDINSVVIINAYMTEDPTIKAPPLTLTLTSSITVKSILVKPETAQQLVNDSQTFTATVMGSDDKPYEGANIIFSVDKGASLSVTSGTSNVNGEVTTQVTGNLSGKVTLTATSNGKTGQATVNFVYKEGSIQLSPRNSSVQVNETVNLTATLMSAGKPVKNAMVTFSTTGDAHLSTTSGNTDDSGTIKTSVTDSSGEAVTVTAKIDAIHDTVEVAFIDVQSVTLKPTTAQQVVNAPQTFTATVMGTNNKPCEGAIVVFSVDKGASLSVTSGTSNVNGEVTTQVTGNLSGKVILTATSNGKTGQATVNFVYKEGSIQLSPRNSSVQVNETVNLTATLMSAGKPVKNAMVTFSTTGDAHLSTTSGNTDDSGTIKTSVTDSSGEAVTVTAKIDAIHDTVEVAFTAINEVKAVVVTPKTAKQYVGGRQDVTATVYGTDNKPYSGAAVNFKVDSGTVFTPSSPTSDDEGEVYTIVTSDQPGTVTFTATSNGKSDKGTVEFITSDYQITIQNAPIQLYPDGEGTVAGIISSIKEGVHITEPMMLNISLPYGMKGPSTVETVVYGSNNFGNFSFNIRNEYVPFSGQHGSFHPSTLWVSYKGAADSKSITLISD